MHMVLLSHWKYITTSIYMMFIKHALFENNTPLSQVVPGP